jgi:hypothetical protein
MTKAYAIRNSGLRKTKNPPQQYCGGFGITLIMLISLSSPIQIQKPGILFPHFV